MKYLQKEFFKKHINHKAAVKLIHADNITIAIDINHYLKIKLLHR